MAGGKRFALPDTSDLGVGPGKEKAQNNGPIRPSPASSRDIQDGRERERMEAPGGHVKAARPACLLLIFTRFALGVGLEDGLLPRD